MASSASASNELTVEQQRAQILKLLRANHFVISLSLCEAAFSRTEVNDIVHDVVGLWKEQRLVDFVCRALQREIDTTEQPNHLLRRDCLATKILAAFARTKPAQAYLRDTLQAPVVELIASKMHITSDGLSDPQEGEKNVQKLRAVCQMLLLAIVNSHNTAPSSFREICAFMKDRVAARFASSAGSSASKTPLHEHQSTSAFLFLRFFCPAILSPHTFKLTKDAPDSETSKMLVLVSKVLTQVASGGGFDRGELQHLNGFVESCQHSVQEFFSFMDRPLPAGTTAPAESGSIKGGDLLSSREGRLLDSVLRWLADGSLIDAIGLDVARATSNSAEALRTYETFRELITRLNPRAAEEPKSSRRRSKLLEWLQKDDRERKEKDLKEKDRSRRNSSSHVTGSVLKREPEVSDLLEDTPMARKWLEDLGGSSEYGARARQLLSQLLTQHRSLQRDYSSLQAAHAIQLSALSNSSTSSTATNRTEDEVSARDDDSQTSSAPVTAPSAASARPEVRSAGRQQLQRSISFGQARVVRGDVIQPPTAGVAIKTNSGTSPSISSASSPRAASGPRPLVLEFLNPDALQVQLSPKRSPKERSPPLAVHSGVARSESATIPSAPIPTSLSQPAAASESHEGKSERRRSRTTGTMDSFDQRDVIVQPAQLPQVTSDPARRGNERSSTSGSRLSSKGKSYNIVKEGPGAALKKS